MGRCRMDALLDNRMRMGDCSGAISAALANASCITGASNGVRSDLDVVGHHIDSTAQRIGLSAEATAQRLGLAGIGSTERNGYEGRSTTDRQGDANRATTERLGLANLEQTAREGYETRETVNKFGLYNSSTTQRVADRLEDRIERLALHNADKMDFYGLKNFEATKDALKDSLLQACGNTDRIVCNDNANAKEIIMQAANNTSALQMKLCALELQQAKDTAAIQLEAAKNTAKIELDAARHAADLARQIAECCCENKSLIIEKANHTDELIRKLDEQRVRDQLQRTHEELVALRLRASLTPALTPAVVV